jgi:transposase
MTPAYARAPRGLRAVGYAPTRGRHTNLVFGLGLRGMVAPLVYKGTTTAPFFTAYVQQCLVPALRHDEIVLMDRHSAHSLATIRPAVRACGAHLWRLPPYSPDLSPIELSGSKVKGVVRRLEPRTDEAMMDAIRIGLESVTPRDIVGWFQHCGYHGKSI